MIPLHAIIIFILETGVFFIANLALWTGTLLKFIGLLLCFLAIIDWQESKRLLALVLFILSLVSFSVSQSYIDWFFWTSYASILLASVIRSFQKAQIIGAARLTIYLFLILILSYGLGMLIFNSYLNLHIGRYNSTTVGGFIGRSVGIICSISFLIAKRQKLLLVFRKTPLGKTEGL